MGDIESSQQAGARLDVVADQSERIVALIQECVQMRARNEPRGAAHGRGVLRKVNDHGDPGHVVPEPAERTLSILVPAAVCRGSFAHGRAVLEPGQR